MGVIGFLLLGSLLLYLTLNSATESPSPYGAETPADRLSPQDPETAFRYSIESIFQVHPIIGPKLLDIEWTSDGKSILHLQEFPIDAMPPEVRNSFLAKMQNRISQHLKAFQRRSPLTIEFLDSDENRVMASFTAEP